MPIETLLLIDDDPRWKEIALKILKDDFRLKRIDTAASKEDVQRLVTPENKYDLYILDGLNGEWQPTAEHIQNAHPDANIVLNSHTSVLYELDALRMGLKIIDKFNFNEYAAKVLPSKD